MPNRDQQFAGNSDNGFVGVLAPYFEFFILCFPVRIATDGAPGGFDLGPAEFFATALGRCLCPDGSCRCHECPSRARGCNGKPPLVAHPELLTAQRPYRPEWELDLFDLKRMDAYLAGITWTKTCTSVGQLRMRKIRYSLGQAWAHQNISVIYDPDVRQFVFKQIRSETRKGKEQPELEPIQRDVKNPSVDDITGLSSALENLPTRQLMLPIAMCQPKLENVALGA